MIHYHFNFKLYFAINLNRQDIGPKSVVMVWPQQTDVEHVMNATESLTLVASGQVQLVSSFSNPLHYSEESDEAVL